MEGKTILCAQDVAHSTENVAREGPPDQTAAQGGGELCIRIQCDQMG